MQASLLLALNAVLIAKLSAGYVSKWAILSFGFLGMAFDEAFSVHEKLIFPMRGLLGGENLGIFYFAWVIPGIAIVLFLFVFFLKFLLHLPSKTRCNFLIAAAIYLGGAIFFELIGGYYAELHGVENLTYSIIVTVEESLEIAGLIMFIWALLVHLADNNKEIRFTLDGNRQ